LTTMKKLASVVSLALAAAGIASGCAVDAADSAPVENIGSDEGAVCANLEGTNAMLASLATAIATELHRFELASDFEIYRGHNYQEMLRIKQTSRSLCTNNCRNIDGLLAFQDSRNDQLYEFKDGTKLNSWTFASRLVAGWRAQKVCEDRAVSDPRTCVAEWHYLEKVSSAPTLCNGTDYGLKITKFKVSRANNLGSKLSPEQALANPDILQRKLLWTDPDQTLPATGNPYLQFRILDNRVELELDPGEGTGEDPIPPGSCGATSLYWSPDYDLTDRCCSTKKAPNGGYQRYAMPNSPPGWYKCTAK